MKRLSTLLVYVCYILYLSGCGSSGGGASADADPKAAPTAPSDPGSTPSTPAVQQPAQPTTVSATYYTLVQNVMVSQGGHAYPLTMTGHCVNYNSVDYCWDDGFQKILAINYERDFWSFCKLNGVIGQGSGGACVDPLLVPTTWTATFSGIALPQHTPSEVYTTGIATSVSCTVTGQIVDCVDFQIDVGQAPQ